MKNGGSFHSYVKLPEGTILVLKVMRFVCCIPTTFFTCFGCRKKHHSWWWTSTNFFSCFPCFFDQVFRKKIRSNHRFLMVKRLNHVKPWFLLGFHPFLLGLHPFLLLFTWFFTRCLPACRCSCRHRHSRGQRLHQWPWHLRPAALLPEKLERFEMGKFSSTKRGQNWANRMVPS